MVGTGLRELLLRADGVGVCDDPAARLGEAQHPVCGDVVQLSVCCRGANVEQVRWRANGCPASMAVAALAAKVLAGVPCAEAAAVLRAAIAAHGGLAAHERHAEAMVLRALAAAGVA